MPQWEKKSTSFKLIVFFSCLLLLIDKIVFFVSKENNWKKKVSEKCFLTVKTLDPSLLLRWFERCEDGYHNKILRPKIKFGIWEMLIDAHVWNSRG